MRNIIVLFVILTSASCTDLDIASKPENFYGDQKMADILTDLYLIDGSMSNNRTSFTDLKTMPTDYIYSKYDTDSSTYRANFVYYSDRIEEYQNLLELVQQNLEVVKDSVAARQERINQEKAALKPKDSTQIKPDPDNQ